MYLHCFNLEFPQFEDLSTRAVPSDSQCEEGIDDASETYSVQGFEVQVRKRKRGIDNQDGLMESAIALKLQNPKVVLEIEEAERD